MRKVSGHIFITFLLGLISLTTLLHFTNTEAYLNSLEHQSKDYRDYDRDGEKDKAHVQHVSLIKVIKLNMQPVINAVVVFSLNLPIVELKIDFVPILKLSDYHFSIFRPPIHS